MSNVAGKAYGMNVLTPMKPWKTWLNTVIFRAGRLLPGTLSGLLGLSLIHFARWVMIRRDQWPDLGQGEQKLQNDYMLFCSNFNGTWDQYIDAFSDGIPNGLDLFWYASTHYPHSIPISPFKDYILHNQYDTSYYYNATPGSAQRDIKAALRVFPVLRELAAGHAAQTPAAFAASYQTALIKVQNDLCTPGYAPVASNDTREADWNREPFMNAAKNARAADVASTAAPVSARPPARAARSDITTSFDGGHYFLTLMIPVLSSEHLVTHYGVECSPVQRLRDTLATLPTALQSLATEEIGRKIGTNSPFARNRRTHLARLVVINDVQYNGRESGDSLLAAIQGVAPTKAQPQDRLSCPFLLFSADIDTPDGSVQSVRGYLTELWNTMQPELRSVLENCYDFERVVHDAASFCDYLMACEIETTMPFNDYWPGSPPLKDRLNEVIMLPAALAITALLLSIFWICGQLGWIGAVLTALAGVGLAVYWAIRRALSIGGQPFPAAPNSDLRSVLKALYLQQQFVRHAVDTQGVDAATQHARFGEFIARHRPDNLDQPTQPPGVVRSNTTGGQS